VLSNNSAARSAAKRAPKSKPMLEANSGSADAAPVKVAGE